MIGFIGNVTQLIATIPSALLVDRLGRRPLLLFGAAFLALAWTVIGILGVASFNHTEHCYKILDCPEGGDYYCDSDALFTSQEMDINQQMMLKIILIMIIIMGMLILLFHHLTVLMYSNHHIRIKYEKTTQSVCLHLKIIQIFRPGRNFV